MLPRRALLAVLLWASPVLAAPTIQVTPAAGHFGQMAVLAKRTIRFTLSNTGDAMLTVGSIAIGAGLDFQVNDTPGFPFLVVPGNSITFEVLTSPQREGVSTDQVIITSNDPVTPNLVIPLDVEGVVASAKIDPTVLRFGPLLLGQPSSAENVTITNTGKFPLTVANIVLAGAAPDAFAVTASKGVTLAAGEALAALITCQPLRAAELSASLVIVLDGFAPAQVKLICTVGSPLAIDGQQAIDFGYVVPGKKSRPTRVGLRNVSTSSLSLSITPSDESFVVDTSTTRLQLASGDPTSITLSFAPKKVGDFRGTIDIRDAASSTVVGSIAVSGNASYQPFGPGTSSEESSAGGGGCEIGRGHGWSTAVVALLLCFVLRYRRRAR